MRIAALLIITILFLAWSGSALVQEDEESAAETTETDAESEDDAAEEEDIIVDDEFYQDADDQDFRPSEDIPADQSIPFPTDI